MNGERLGIFGQLHPQYAATLDLPAAVYVFELDLEVLLSRLEERYRQIIFQPFSTYPASDRDLAFFAPGGSHCGRTQPHHLESCRRARLPP